jgi:hypothetical protein
VWAAERIGTVIPMSVRQDLQRELDRIQAQGGVGLLRVDLPHARIEADLTLVDAIGCAFQTLGLTTDRLATAPLEQLKNVSEALTRRLTYLLEPIGLIEADADRCAVQLRSSPPHKGDDGTFYYELMVRRGGHITLSRYCQRPGQMRQIVPAQVTREVLARLADDFLAVLP